MAYDCIMIITEVIHLTYKVKYGFSLAETIMVLAISSIALIAIMLLYSLSIRETEKVRIKTEELGVISRIDLVLQKELMKAGPESTYVRPVKQSGNVVGIRYKVDIPLNHHDVTKQVYFKNGAVFVWEKDFSVSDFPESEINTLELNGSRIAFSTQQYPGLEISFNLGSNEIDYQILYGRTNHYASVNLLAIK